MSIYKRDDKEFKKHVAELADKSEYKPFRKTEQKVTTATIDEKGDVLFLASNENDIFCELGDVVTKRASHVEPATFWARGAFHFLRLFGDKTRVADWTRGWKVDWRVNTKPVGGPILTYGNMLPKTAIRDLRSPRGTRYTHTIVTWSNRQDAIDAEIKFLNWFFLEGK